MKNITIVSRLAIIALASSMAIACSGGEKAEEKTAEATPEATAPAAGAEAPAATATAVAYSTLTGDAAKGEKVFAQCKACHVIEMGQNRVGPSLHKIIGRKSGQVEGYSYSAANKGSGAVWDEETMYKYLENPRGFMPGTKMSFAGLKKPQDRADVIAYLKTKAI